MSLYTYVPGKTELCNLMLDNVYLAMPRPPFVGRDWRAKLTQVMTTAACSRLIRGPLL